MINYFLLAYLICVAAVDIYKREIPFRFSLSYIAVIVMIQIVVYRINIITLLLGIIIGFLLMAISILTKGAVGMGDGIMFLVIGCAMGFVNTLDILAGSLLLSSVFSIMMLAGRRVGRGSRIPFAPFACAAYGGMILFG